MFTIIRAQKIKSKEEFGMAMSHSFRLINTPNSDDKKLKDNIYLYSETKSAALKKFNERLPANVRKNAVYCIEYMISASPEFFSKNTSHVGTYFKQSIEFIKRIHGEENIVHVGVHMDETTPHLHLFVVPIDNKNKLNCRFFLGGKEKLINLQTDFSLNVGTDFGLERGIKGSPAKHTTIKQFYNEVNKIDNVSLPQLPIQPTIFNYISNYKKIREVEVDQSKKIKYQELKLKLVKKDHEKIQLLLKELKQLKIEISQFSEYENQSVKYKEDINTLKIKNKSLIEHNNWLANQKLLLISKYESNDNIHNSLKKDKNYDRENQFKQNY
jgi:hypothetical protein